MIKAAIRIFKRVFGYLLTLAIVFGYAMFLDGFLGWFLFVALIAVPLLSVLLTFAVKPFLRCEVTYTNPLLYKKEQVMMQIKLTNDSILPVAAVQFSTGDAVSFSERGKRVITTSIAPMSSVTTELTYTAAVWSISHIGPEYLFLSDFFGIVRLPVYSEIDVISLGKDIEIFPNVPEADAKNDLVKTLCDTAAYEDSEESSSSTILPSGIAGYEHREYYPGDPIKRINWKLSSKRDVYMLRMDEEITNSKQVIVLDACSYYPEAVGTEAKLAAAKMDERIVEALLSMLLTLSKLGLQTILWLYMNGHWEMYTIDTVDEVYIIQLYMAKYRFNMPSGALGAMRIPEEALSSSGRMRSLLLCTSRFDRSLHTQLDNLQGSNIDVHTVVASNEMIPSANTWHINEDYTLTRN